jgi:hypothetical protein
MLAIDIHGDLCEHSSLLSHCPHSGNGHENEALATL